MVNSSTPTPKNFARLAIASVYSGYMESASAVTYLRRHSTTLGEQPTVFSLKSRRSFPARPPVGGEYGVIWRTAARGARASHTTHLHRTGMRFESFRAGQLRNRRRQSVKSLACQFLHRDHLN